MISWVGGGFGLVVVEWRSGNGRVCGHSERSLVLAWLNFLEEM